MTVVYFKNEGKTKTFLDKQKMAFINNNLPFRKSFRLKEMNIRYNLKTYEEIKSTGKSNYIGKHKSQCYWVFFKGVAAPLFSFLYYLKDKCIK